MSEACRASITHRDEDHRQSVCVLPETHRTPHDDGEGCVWTDADHWQYGETKIPATGNECKANRAYDMFATISGGDGNSSDPEVHIALTGEAFAQGWFRIADLRAAIDKAEAVSGSVTVVDDKARKQELRAKFRARGADLPRGI